MLNDYDDRDWLPVEKEISRSEDLGRKSMSYAKDSWRRLKENKIALLALGFIVLILMGAIFIPKFYPISYSYQRLEFANIPSRLKIYPLDENHYVYITNEYKAIQVDDQGRLLGMASLEKDEMMARQKVYLVDGKELLVDYSQFFEAKKEFIALERRSKSGKTLRIKDAHYLRDYYGEEVSDEASVGLDDAKMILEKYVPKVRLSYDGKPIKETITKWNKTFIWGSDSLGRDLFIRVIYGARMSLTVGFAAALLNFVIGVLYGGIAGYFGGRVDNIMMRFVDIISSIPMMLYVILIMVVIGPGLTSIIFAMAITYWVGMARIVRAQVLSLREQEFVMAIQVLGGGTLRILTKHLIPNTMGPIMVSLSMQIPSAMFTEAFLSFTGLGVAAPQASWGTLCNDALQGLTTYPYQMFYPAIVMSLTILAFNLFSDGLRNAMDPKLRK